MSYIAYKTVKNKTYAYEITAHWDKEKKQSRRVPKYLGPVDPDTKIITPFIKKNHGQENLILDFGDGYYLHEIIKKNEIYNVLKITLFDKFPDLLPLIIYRICTQAAMYNCDNWFGGNIISLLFKNVDLSSQRISDMLTSLGDESIQRKFLSAYLVLVGGSKKSVIIDATSLPNKINIDFNEWGRSDGSIEKQFRLICVIDQIKKPPLFYRLLPGNMIDVSTLKTTILELKELKVNSSYILMDAGYFSEDNVCELYEQHIDFLTRMPAGRKIYNDIILNKSTGIEKLKNANTIGLRSYFIKAITVDLYGNKAYAFIVLDPERKAKETKELLQRYCKENFDMIEDKVKLERKKNKYKLEFSSCGIMVLISSKKIAVEEVLSSYGLRQSVEQVFSVSKSDLSLLPIRNHNERTVRGYLFLQFILLILYLRIQDEISKDYTVEQLLLTLRKLKCKVFDDKIIPSELTKKQRIIFEDAEIIVPNFLGI